MSGHSKWHNIKRRKESVDAKKGAAFTKFSLEIVSAVQTGGSDPAGNATLRDAIERARKAGFPQANIDRLLDKQTHTNQQAVTYEAIGPAGVGIIIIARTDNTNRTVGQLRTLLADYDGTLGGPNSVMWKFTHDAASNTYQPKFPLPIDEAGTAQLSPLLAALQARPDVERIFTDTVQ